MSSTDETAPEKQAAIAQWTADPCGPETGEAEPGTRPYAEALIRGREAYAPWMAEQLGYGTAAGLRVLDVGCGQGIDVMRFAQAGADVTGIDLTPHHADLARRHVAAMGLNAEIVNGDAESLPFTDGTFDRVTSNGVLHHTPDMDAALRGVLRVLKPGGEARIIVYNRASFHYWIEQVGHEGLIRRKLFTERSMEGVMSSGVEISSVDARPLVRVYSPKQLRTMLTDAGFVEVHTEVRHFNQSDTFVTDILGRRIDAVNDPRFRDRLGRLGGWYVIGYGRRPSVSV